MKQDSKKSELIDNYRQKLEKSCKHLDYSLKRTLNLKSEIEKLTDEELEKWEGLVSRFSRTVDIFTNKFLRYKVLEVEPGFRGSTRDLLDTAEKLGFIEKAQFWFEMKELRNKQAHEYDDEDLSGFFEQVRKNSKPVLENVLQSLKKK